MSKTNFSLLLALRYLNPIRTNVSVITVISLLGVAAGVMVLIVTLSVMNGFESLLKDIVLTSRPHIYLEHRSISDHNVKSIKKDEWESLQNRLERQDIVKSVSPRISDFVVLEKNDQLLPKSMLGIDTDNPDELKKFEEVVKEGNLEGLQEGETIIISSKLRDETGISLGDIVLVHSSSTLKKLQPILRRIEQPLFIEENEQDLTIFENLLNNDAAWTNIEIDGDFKESVNFPEVQFIANEILLNNIENNRALRAAERNILQRIYNEFAQQHFKNESENTMEYNIGTRAIILDYIKELKNLDKKTIDDQELREMQSFALPKELTVVGISTVNNFAKGTDMFVPFHVAQDLTDLDGGIQGFSISIHKPYHAAEIKEQLVNLDAFNFTDNYRRLWEGSDKQWIASTWMESNIELFEIMELQKFLMVLVLSFIVLIAVFSIAAVMFTVAIQKKREIGVMKALGATPRQIINVFAYQGFIVGFLGSLIGVITGYLIAANVGIIQLFIKNQLHFNPFPKSIYGTETMPSETVPMEVAIIAVGALVLCTLASLAPAWAASRADAARSLRNL